MLRSLLLTIAFALSAIPALGQIQAPAPSPQDVEKVVRTFIKNLDGSHAYQKNLDWVTPLVHSGAAEGALWQKVWHDSPDSLQLRTDKVEISAFSTESAQARVTYHWFNAGPKSGPIVLTENLHLQKSPIPGKKGKTRWQILPMPADTIEEMEAIGFVFEKEPDGLVHRPRNIPVLNKAARAVADPIKAWGEYCSWPSQGHLMRIWIRTQAYTNWGQNKFSFQPELYPAALKTQGPAGDYSQIPGTKEIYTFNKRMFGQTNPWEASDMSLRAEMGQWAGAKPTRLVLFYEGKDEELTYRYSGRGLVLLADGNIELVTPEQAKTLIWEP